MLVTGKCTLENDLPVFRGSALAASQVEDTPVYAEATHRAIQAVADGVARGSIDNDGLEAIDIPEIARGMTACNGPATMLPARTEPERRYIVLDEGALGVYAQPGVTLVQLRQIAMTHEYGHVYTNRSALEALASASGGDPDTLGELLADSYMLLRLKSRDVAMAAPVDAFLQLRNALWITDKAHPIMPAALKARLDAKAATLTPVADDKAVFQIAASLFSQSLTAAPARPAMQSLRARVQQPK